MSYNEQTFKRVLFLKRPYYPAIYLQGMRGSGKSVAGERICEIYYNRGYVVLDLWAAVDKENAFWCIPGILDKDRGYKDGKKQDPYARDVGYPVAIIAPKTTIIEQKNPLCVCGKPMGEHNETTKCSKPRYLIKVVPDTTPLKELLLLCHRERRVCVFNPGFYANEVDALNALASYLRDLIQLALQESIPSYISMVLFLREMGNIVPQGLQVYGKGLEAKIKRPLQKLVREARHMRIVFVGDFQRSADIAPQIVSQRDFFIFKRITKDLIPLEYQWLYDAINQKRARAFESMDFEMLDSLTSLSVLRDNEAVAVWPDNYYKKIYMHMAGFKHKKNDESWSVLANCEIKYVDAAELKAKKSDKILAQEAKAQEKLEMLKTMHVLKQQRKSWEEIVVQVKWPGYNKMSDSEEAKKKCLESAAQAYSRARRRGLLDSPAISNANSVVTPSFDQRESTPAPA